MNHLASTFKQPTSQAQAMTMTPPSSQGRHLRNHPAGSTLLPSILVVDDDALVLEMLHDALDLWGFQVYLAKNGCEGLSVLINQQVDGILLDMDMPVMDGLTMLDELRWLGYPMPVVIMSGSVRSADLRQVVKEGAQGFLDKPFSLPFLRDVCATIFEDQVSSVSTCNNSNVERLWISEARELTSKG